MGVEQLNPTHPVEASKKVKRSFLEQAGVPGGLLLTIGAAIALVEPTQIVKLIIAGVGVYSALRAVDAFYGRP